MSRAKLKEKGNQNVNQLSNPDHVAINSTSSQYEAQLYIFEDREAVIEMIIKGRSPMMKHVSRTHRVALDGLFDRISLEPPRSKADILTPKANSLTCSLKAVSRVMNGTIFCAVSSNF